MERTDARAGSKARVIAMWTATVMIMLTKNLTTANAGVYATNGGMKMSDQQTELAEYIEKCRAMHRSHVGKCPTFAHAVSALADQLDNAHEQIRRGADAMREAFGPELSALGHPAYVVVHLRDELDKVTQCWKQAECHLDDISAAIGTHEFMDLPDGGSITLAEQVRRMSELIGNLRRDVVVREIAEAALSKALQHGNNGEVNVP